MDYVEMYYTQVHGCYPFDTEANRIKSKKIIDYLRDAEIGEKEIMDFIENAPAADCLAPDMLPESLWEGSLLKKGRFYYHRTLHILSDPPTWDPVKRTEVIKPFSLEMRIRFTIDDLLNYYYKEFRTDMLLMDRKRDGAALKYLIERYGKYSCMDPVDFVLFLIDFAANNTGLEFYKVRTPLDLNAYESDIYGVIDSLTKEASFQGANKIVWR